MTNSSSWRSSEPLWGYHNNRSVGRSGGEDVRPKVKRFEYMDRMALQEADERAAEEQGTAAYQASLSPVRPSEVYKVDGVEVSVFSGPRALELRRRDSEAEKLRKEARR